jgi:Dyp-type peroxidase family
MPTKYYEKILTAQAGQKPTDALPPFDAERLRTRSITGKLASRFLENPRWFFRFLRFIKPNVKLGPILLVTKNADVRDVLERQDVFETPFGPEMTEMAGGSNFILGMRDGEEYRRMKSAVLSAFPVSEVESVVRPLAARHSREIMLRATSGFDIVDRLLKIVPVRICRDYYGLVIDDEDGFADRAIAMSSLFFADFFGSPDVRELAVVAARDMRGIVDRSINEVRSGTIGPATPLARLVALHDKDPEKLTMEQIHSIMVGMITGFVPTNLLAAGNCLDFVLSRREAQNAVEEAVEAKDDALLDRAIVEAMRFKPINFGPQRYARSDAVIAQGTSREYHVKAGTTLIPSTLSAMFDDDEVPAPESFDPTRAAGTYMVFGHGIHWCIGAALAKIQIAEAFKVIFSKQNVQRAPGKNGKLRRRGAFPESLCINFDVSADNHTVEQAMVTLCFPVLRNADLEQLRESIAGLGNPCEGALKEGLDKTGIIHFTSIALVGSGPLAGPADDHPAQLVWEFSADGSPERAIEMLARTTADELRPILEKYCGFSGETAFEKFLKQHHVEFTPSFLHDTGLAFSGTPGHSVGRIHAEARLEKTVSAMIADQRREGPHHAAGILQAVRQRLAEAGNHDWAFQPAESLLEKMGGTLASLATGTLLRPAFLVPLMVYLALFTTLNYLFVLGGSRDNWTSFVLTGASAFGVTLLGTAVAAVLILGALYLFLRRKESNDKPSDEQVPFQRYGEIVDRENRSQQNHLTGISVMKEGPFRRLTLKFVFKVIAAVARFQFRPGYLGDINTIHFARWVLLPGTNKLVFFSNYDGSWESYLEDFITKAHQGLTGVWSNTAGFPKTRGLFGEGAKDGDRFKRWARMQQAPTLFWYSAYPELDTRRIRINSAIRQGLARAESESEAQAWLDLFGTIPRPASVLETNDIQSIVFGPMGSLKLAELIGFDVPGELDPGKRRQLLEWLSENISFGEKKPEVSAMTVAFGPAALVKFGLEDSASFSPIAEFPPAFRQGMANQSRGRILGDSGDSGFENWQWGNDANSVELVIVCYATSKKKLDSMVREVLKQSDAAGLAVTLRQPLNVEMEGNRAIEPFGFADGISQPLIDGTARALSATSAMHVVKPGEFLLGYPDERGTFPPSPQVPAFTDRKSILPAPASQRGVNGDGHSVRQMRDFGRNGTFMVIRQLQQHVGEFHDFCAKAAQKLQGQIGTREDISGNWVAAKMVGRWQDGSSLVRNPYGKPGKPADNDFLFGTEDPQGMKCPLGAHVRRANPRDSLGLDHDQQIELTKRHRMLRVGRRYDVKKSGSKKSETGLIFICLNASIERQFEFVQQTWLGAAGFQGLANERDPMAALSAENGQFTIPTEEGAVSVAGLKDFITVRGGGYFFMPGKRAIRYLAAR